MKRIILATVIFLIVAVPIFAAESIIFTGIPKIKISEGGVSRITENVPNDKAIQFKCTITQLDDKYFWTSRDNVELLAIANGAFITYWAIKGSGYVRVTNPEMRETLRRMGILVGDPEAEFDYVEHLLLGLKSVTYYGTAK